ncbi:hypothetical protein J1N35_041418 [Gossypium stocksii]|uniref:RNase H type-1 domain-containing protein n=1 Tax=Gossypium stocksii TaxID=47602 RepID=A0A9D3UFL5_9ROSI|nr:hypothetical protein J1N35_041418 [Gossypium stocksii]
MGDFDAILSSKDKRSLYIVGKRCSLFGNFVDSCELQDLRFSGPAFTWQRSGTSIRLDRALAGDAWMASFLQCLVSHLPRIKSDYRPLLLSIRLGMDLVKDRHFKFLAGWTKHNNFSTFIKEKWNFAGNMADSLNNFTSYAKDWNKNIYGFLGSSKQHLMRSLNNIQKALDHSDSSFLAKQEMKIQDELENVLNHEELLWRQKAEYDWIHLGDRNMKFFHSRTIKKRKFNRIIALRISNGVWCSNQDILQTKAMGFFEKLYGEVPQALGDLPNISFPHLKPSNITFLEEEQARFIAGRNLSNNIILAQEVIHSMHYKDWLGHLIGSDIDIGRWKPIQLLRKAWAIGDGASVRCWKDSWIPGMGSLLSKIPSSSNLDLDCFVKELVNSDGSWNLELFHVWLPEDVINRIISIPPLHPVAGSDRAIWAWSTSGVFRFVNNASYLNHANIFESTRVLLSTDGAVARDSGHTAIGGVVRGKDGNWIIGFGHYLGVCSSSKAEVWSILDGILLLLNKGYRQTIVQTNSLEVVQALNDMGMDELEITVLRRTQHIMNSEGQWKILHIPREQNLVADQLAKPSLNWKSTLQVFDDAPKEILELLQNDKVYSTFM